MNTLSLPVPIPTTNLATNMATNLAWFRLPNFCGTSDIMEYNKFPDVNITEHVIATGRIVPNLSASAPKIGAKINCANASVATINPYWDIVVELSS